MKMYLTIDGSVKFPGLGITFEHLIEGFNVFGFHISLSGILIAVALLVGLFLTEHLAKKTGQNPELYLELAIYLVIAGIIGARIGYIITHWEVFSSGMENVFNISTGMSFSGAVIAGLVVSLFYCKSRKYSWLKVCDTLTPGVLFGQVLGVIGQFLERSVLGTYSDGIFAMQVDIQDVDMQLMRMSRSSVGVVQGDFLQVHPITLYELILFFILFIVLILLFFKNKINGMMFAIYLIIYGGIRFFTEFIRLDARKTIGGMMSLEHIVSIGLILFGVLLLTSILKHNSNIKKEKPKNFV